MNDNLIWITAPRPSLLHAAAMVARGRTLVDAELEARLAPLVAAANADALRAGVEQDAFWRNVVPWGAGLASPLVPDVARHLADELESVNTQAASDELALRGGPLRQAWEARGPGLWRSLRQLTREELQLPAASIILVRPVLGGGGGVAFGEHAAVSIEAMLANSHWQLPEVVRLAWLLAQLAAPAGREAALALVPATLAAAEEVELARCDLPTLQLALAAWQIAASEECAGLAPQLFAWWQSFLTQRQRFPTAVHSWRNPPTAPFSR